MTAFLTRLAVTRNVSASTRNQALAVILFLDREVLDVKLPWLKEVVRAKKLRCLSTVLAVAVAEVDCLLSHVPPHFELIVRLFYGSGLRMRNGSSDELNPAAQRVELRAPFQIPGQEKLLAAHDVNDVYDCACLAIEDATGRLDDLAITPGLRLRGLWSHAGMVGQMIDMAEDALHEPFCRFQIFQRDVISDCIEITGRRL